MLKINVPRNFGRIADYKRSRFGDVPTIVFTADNHASGKSIANIEKLYVYLATNYGLKLLGIEGYSGIKVNYESGRPLKSKRWVYRAIGDYSLGYSTVGVYSYFLGLEAEIFGWENKDLLTEQGDIIRFLYALETPELRKEVLTLCPSESQLSLLQTNALKRYGELTRIRTTEGIERLLERMKERKENLAMMVMGAAHTKVAKDYLDIWRPYAGRKNGLIDYYFVEPVGLNEEDEKAMKRYELELRPFKPNRTFDKLLNSS